MTDLKPFLKKMLSLPGLSAYEGPVRDAISEAWRPLVDDLSVSRLGSLHGLRRGKAADPRPRLLISAHMDAIGLMVTGVVDGLLRVTSIGGIDARILPSQPVTVHGRRDLPGVVIQPLDRVLPPAARGKPVALENLLVDTGLTTEEVSHLVRVGDLVSFATLPVDLGSDGIAGHSLDNRVSVAALTVCLQELQHISHEWDVWAVASVQEEVSLGGAFTSPFEVRPDLTVAVDVTFAKGPGSTDHRCFSMGKGPTIGWGPNIHPALFNYFKDLADRLDLPYQVEVMPAHSGTDAYAMQVVAEGIPTAVIGIPLRYMHTPVEVGSYKDIFRTGHLLAQFVANLPADFVKQIRWDETP